MAALVCVRTKKTSISTYESLSDYINGFMKLKRGTDRNTKQELWKMNGFGNAHVSIVNNHWPYGDAVAIRYLICLIDETKNPSSPLRKFYRDVVADQWVTDPEGGGARPAGPLAVAAGPRAGTPARLLWDKLQENKRFCAQIHFSNGYKTRNYIWNHDNPDSVVYPVSNPEVTSQNLTIYEYSKLYQALQKFANLSVGRGIGTNFLKELCFEMSFFTKVPNECIMQYNSQRYYHVVCEHCSTDIAELIFSFLDQSHEHLKWIVPDRRWEQMQLHFSCNGHIVDFRNAKLDFINIRTQLLNLNAVYYINVYVISKNDEMSFGIIAKDAYSTTVWPDYCEGSIQYTDRGRIGVNRSTIGKVKGFGSGDWITIHIDFPEKRIVFYKNGVKQRALDSKHFLEGECYFWTYLDRPQDAVFIKCAPELCFAEAANAENAVFD